MRIAKRTPVLAHVYQTPPDFTIRSLPLPVDAFVASSKRIAKTLESHARGSAVFAVPPSVDTSFFKPDRNAPCGKTGLYIGNLSENRFPNALLDILREVVRADSTAIFRVIAPINHINVARAHEIAAISRTLGIADKVRILLRNLDDNEKLREYCIAKFFLFAPASECREVIEPPLTVLEALACGLPVLATDTYSVNEAVVSGKNGVLIDANNYMNLAEPAIDMLRADSSRWQAWSTQARQTALDSFSLPSVSKRLAKVCSDVLES
jgi:glycosyltransferase involved in cell wall biosynthesis